jgi:GPH family glycoside/pentoside/hexuronide:cation symporter
MKNSNLQTEEVSKMERFGYVMGNIPISLIGGIFFLTYFRFFHDILELDPVKITLAMGIYAVVNAFNDPILALWSDNVNRKKWGSRRLIFIRWGGLLWAIFFVLSWYPWSTTNQNIMFWHFLFTMCSFDMGLTIVVMCWMALLAEMTSDVDLRVKLSFISGLMQLFGLVVVVISGIMLDTSLKTFRIFSIIIAVIAVIMFFLVSVLCHERVEFIDDEMLPLWPAIKETVKSKSFMIFIGYNFFSAVTVASLGLSFMYLFILIIPGGMYVFYGIFFLVKFIGQFICSKLRPKWGIRKTTLIFILIQVLGSIALGVLSILLNNNMLVLIGFIWLTFFGGYSVFLTTLQTISMDEDELKTGSRRETTFLGVNALFTKPADSIGPIIVTWILVGTNYVNNGAFEDQPLSAINGIRALLLLLPLIFVVLGAIFMYFYPLHGEKMKQLRIDLDILHQQKKEKVTKLQT